MKLRLCRGLGGGRVIERLKGLRRRLWLRRGSGRGEGVVAPLDVRWQCLLLYAMSAPFLILNEERQT